MDTLEKLFRKIPKADRQRIKEALEKILVRDFTGLQRQKLKGYEHIFRIRIGNFRIIYYDDGEEIILKAVQRRREDTYSRF
jgi:mRNA interferase RelE/StbE